MLHAKMEEVSVSERSRVCYCKFLTTAGVL